jgi:phage gpG-like protein
MAGAAVSMTAGDFNRWCQEQGGKLAQLDLSPVMRQGAVLVVADLKGRYDRSVSPDGVPWAPLKRPRRRSAGADKPLLDTGQLRAAVTAVAVPGGIVASNAVGVAGFHQEGTRHMVARPNVGFSGEFLADFQELLADYVAEHLLA